MRSSLLQIRTSPSTPDYRVPKVVSYLSSRTLSLTLCQRCLHLFPCVREQTLIYGCLRSVFPFSPSWTGDLRRSDRLRLPTLRPRLSTPSPDPSSRPRSLWVGRRTGTPRVVVPRTHHWSPRPPRGDQSPSHPLPSTSPLRTHCSVAGTVGRDSYRLYQDGGATRSRSSRRRNLPVGSPRGSV